MAFEYEDQYPNLPGILSEFKDGGLQLRVDPNPPSTDSVLILGTAVDGPILEPVAVDPSTAVLVFGSATLPNGLPNGSTLIKAFEEAYAGGCRDIRLMRVTGKQAELKVMAKEIAESVEKPINEPALGMVGGNAEVTFVLNQTRIDVNSVSLNVGGANVSSAKFTVTQGSDDDALTTTVNESSFATVTLAANVANAGESVFITYKSEDGSQTFSENAHTASNPSAPVYWIAEGADQIIPLQEQPIAEAFKLYANGVEVASEAYTLSGASVILHPGHLKMNDFLEATYLSAIVDVYAPALSLKAVYGGQIYNQTKVKVENIESAGGQVVGKLVVITKPESKKAQDAEEPLTFSSLDFPNFELMANAINQHPMNNVVRASVSEKHKYNATSELDSTVPEKSLVGGNDGIHISAYELYEALGGKKENGVVVQPGAYQLLENYNVDYIVPAGAFADEVLPGKYDNFAYQLALACAVISHRNDTVLGVIATKSPDEAGLVGVRQHVEKVMKNENNYFMRDRAGNVLRGSDGNPIDLGRFLSVIVGPDLVFTSPTLGTYSGNSAAAYAGYMTTLPAQQAPTNKPINFAIGMRYNFSNAQLDALTGRRFVTYKYKNNGAQIAVTDAMTAAQPTSDYRRQNTVRVVKAVVDAIRRIADPFIGQPNETAQRNALSSAISKELDSLKEVGVISDSEFNMVASPQDVLLGQLKIELTLVPPQELRRITTVVSLRPSL